MSYEENVKLRFVIPKLVKNENLCSDDMKMAFQSCVEHELVPEWILEDCCAALKPTKQDVFVFQEFKGDIFSQFRSLKCIRLLGPRCLLTCLMEGSPIPEGRSPIFTTAMRDLVVTTTNFSGMEKEELINKIEYMGALFSSKLIGSTTHLVAKNVLSVKYEKAVEKGLPVMTEKWVTSLWEESCQRNVHASNPEFQIYKCPVFHGLTVTCSNLSRHQKEEIRNLINKNGGIFSGQLEYENTKLLVVNNPTGEKYRYAREWKLPCVLPSWVHESVKEGYAVSVEPYVIQHEVKCSTPIPDETRVLPDFSMLSTIAPCEQGNNATHVNETIADITVQTICSNKPTSHRHAKVQHPGVLNSCEVLESLDLSEAKKAGAFLDGCNVYLSGFNSDQTEKLRRVLNGGGAVRFNEISGAVTHMIVGEIVPADVKILKTSGYRPYILTLEWVIESIKLKYPASEDKFLCTDLLLQPTEPPSPLSKKGLQLLKRPNEKSIPSFELPNDDCAKNDSKKTEKVEHPVTTDLVHQYLQNAQPAENDPPQDRDISKQLEKNMETLPVAEEETLKPKHGHSNNEKDRELNPNQDSEFEQMSTEYTSSSSIIPIFSTLTFFVIDFTDDVTKLLTEIIVSHGGSVVGKNFRGIADYAIVPVNGAKFTQAASEVVSYMWVEDCHGQNELVPIMYYHCPISIDLTKKPLKGCVIGISSYTGKERDFIFAVAQMLGAITQEMFARKDNEKKKALASTHLVCSEPGSQKYNAALKWKLPAVSHEWVLACAKEGRRVSEEPYLIGESTCAEKSHKSSNMGDLEARTFRETSKDVHKKMHSPSVSVGRPEDNGSVAHTSKSNLKLVNKRVEELQTNTVMGPPPSPAERPGSATKAHTLVTPPNRCKYGFSQESPINIPKVLETPKNDKSGWPTDVNQATPKGPFSISTPQTPYGQVLKPNPSPETRKNWKKWIDNFPDFEKEKSPTRKRKLSTPLSELKRQCWEKILPKNKPSVADDAKSSESTDEEEKTLPDPARCNLYSSTTASTKNISSATTAKCSDSSPLSETQRLIEEPNDFISNIKSSNSKSNLKRLRSIDYEVHDKVVDPEHFSNRKIEYTREESKILVGWEDPLEIQERKSVTYMMKNGLSPTFMMSGVVERDEYEEIIQSLGGQVTDKPAFDPAATHLICNRPVRSEKLLASIASGKWVLHKSYIDASQKEKRFLREEEFEWGNPAAVSLMRDIKPESLESTLAKAAYRWRSKLIRENDGAFIGMRAVLCISREREEPFKRLILAGGGRLVEFSRLDEATHCFLELNKVTLPVKLSAIVKKRIPCVAPIYLNDYLIKDPPPLAHESVIPEYKALL